MNLPTESQWARYSMFCMRLKPLPAPEQVATLQALRAQGDEDPQVLSLIAVHFALPSDPDRLRIGERVGSCTLEEPLGAGGMGVVYRAQQHLGPARRPVALKLIHPALLRAAREEARARFLAELHTLVTLQHEGIARIYDGGLDEDSRTHEHIPYLVMELVRGGLPITTYAKDYALSWQERLALFVRVCHAVRYAHEHRVIHRDLKPANILVDSDGRPVVIDFGLAQACDVLLPGAHLAATGTPAYMSPEQVSDAFGAVSEKSDGYALGLILYELLTEQPPYVLPRDGAVAQWRQVILEATPLPLSQYNTAYSGELEAIVALALAKRPGDRLSVAVLRSRLERSLQRLPPESQTPPAMPLPPRLPVAHPPETPDVAASPALSALPLPKSTPPLHPELPSLRHRPAGERQLVTVLCGTLAQTTALADRLGFAALQHLVQTFHTLAQDCVQRYEGTVQALGEDGVLALFGVPVAQEDHAWRAVRAALELQQRLQEAPAGRAVLPGEELTARMGVHTGWIVAGSRRDESAQSVVVGGDTTQGAMHLQALAAPGTLVVSATTLRLLRATVRSTAYGLVRVPGYTHPLIAYTVQGIDAPTATRVWSPFVGRQRELAVFDDLLARAIEGQGQVVGLVGEPGMGKSRLLAEFRQRLPDRPVRVLEGHCRAYDRLLPYTPVCDLLRHQCGLSAPARPDVVATQVDQLLREVGLSPEDSAPYLLQLLGSPATAEPLALLPPEVIKERTFALLRQVHLRSSQQQPLLLVVENLHWIDPTSEAYLASLVEQLVGVPLLLLTTYRPGYRPLWMDKSYATQLTLPPLTREESRALVRAVLPPERSAEALVQRVLARAEGNPLFLEELAKAVQEQDGLAADTPVPETIQAVLAARIDRLPPEAKHLLHTAAVIGPEVPVPLLAAIAELPEAVLHRSLAHLQAAEFLYERRLVPEWVYTFKHVLTQEVAYASLLQERRRLLHARIVEALEALAPERGAEVASGPSPDQVERLAHHALRGEVWAKAVTYCQQAGVRACDRAAFGEAVAAFEQALQALAHLPEHGDTRGLALELRLALGDMLAQLGEFGRYRALLGEAETLARALDDRARLVWVLTRAVDVLRITGDHDGAIAAGQQAFELAAELSESALQVQASLHLGRTYSAIGDFARAAELLRWSVEAADREVGTSRTDLLIRSQAWLALTLGALGAFAEGRRHGEEALRLATLAGRGAAPIAAHTSLGLLYLAQGDLEHALRVLEQGLALCQASGNRAWLRWILAGLGYASAHWGRLAEGRALLEEGISEGIRTGAPVGQAYRVAWLSEVWRLAGRGEEAWQHACQALDLARQQKARGDEALALYQLGAVHAHADPPDVEQAEAHYQQALALAEELGMRPLQAHCHLGLGTLYTKTGRREQACAALSTAVNLYRAMEMTFWLPQAEAALAQVEGQ